jgi:UDP-N-acetyl-D-mannosaminuronic acid transferase (WecB/TagA/CpsF family)
VGVDGTLLRVLLGRTIYHSSADKVLPKLIGSRNLKVLLVGGTSETAKLHAESFSGKFPNCNVSLSIPGDPVNLARVYETALTDKPNLIILGLGPGLQDVVALELFATLGTAKFSPLIVTCGGWLDQISKNDYFPTWSYKLRMNWLLRLLREPRRLWKRYSYWAVKAILSKRQILESLSGVTWMSGFPDVFKKSK